MKVALYARVSTEEQTTDNQVLSLTQYANARGWQIAEIYQESESAWRFGHQKELGRLYGDIKASKKQYDAVLVWALDRLTREGVAAILNMVDRFKRHGVRIISKNESWTEAPGELAELLYAVTGWVARMESQRLSDRTRAGIARARESGKVLGRPKGSKDGRKRKNTGYLLRFASPELKKKYGNSKSPDVAAF